MAPPPALLTDLEMASVKIQAAFEADWLEAGCPDDCDVLSEQTTEMFSTAIEPARKYLDAAFWAYTTNQISGIVVGDISGPLLELYDAFERLWNICGRYVPLTFCEGLITSRQRIADRAERYCLPPPEGNDAGCDDDDNDELMSRPCEGLRYGGSIPCCAEPDPESDDDDDDDDDLSEDSVDSVLEEAERYSDY